jgi:hypothetical protein
MDGLFSYHEKLVPWVKNSVNYISTVGKTEGLA